MDTHELTLYFDGQCPFCAAEMRRLHSWDRAGRLRFVDIAEPGFDPGPLGVSLAALNRELHSWTSSGQRLVGIDSMIALSPSLRDKDLADIAEKAEARMLMANLWADDGEFQQAAASYAEVIRRSPAFVEAYNNLGLLYFKQRKLGSAKDHLEQAIRKDPNYAPAHYNLGLVLSQMGEGPAGESPCAGRGQALAVRPNPQGA